MLWHHMLTRDLIEASETTVRYGWEVDALLADNGGALARLNVAEVLSRAAAAQGLSLPVEDSSLIFSLRFYGVPRSQWSGGTILTTSSGLVAYALGDGRTIESTGPSLTILREPEDRYVAGYRHPQLSHH